MQPHVVVLLLVSLGSAWWIGSRFTDLLPSESNVLVEHGPSESVNLTQSVSAKTNSPFDVVETELLQDVSPGDKAIASDADSPLQSAAIEPWLQVMIAQPLTGESETALLEKLEFWSVTQPAEASLWIERTLGNAWPGSPADALRYPLLSLWIEIEPEVAIAQLGAFADEAEIPFLMLSYAARLADESSPEEAFEWARSIEDQASSEVIVNGLFQRWLETDIRALATYIESDLPQLQFGFDTSGNKALTDDQTDSLIPERFKKRVATALIAEDPARALRWADALSSSGAEKVRSEAIDNWLVHDPVSASNWLTDVLNDTGTLPLSLASTVAQHDIDLAINTVPSLSGASQGAMTGAIVETLSEIDPEDARAWVDGLVDPQARSAATAVWARANAERQPAEALDSALRLTSTPGRLDVLVEVAATVARVDQPLVESWLAAAPLSNYERSQIANIVLDTDNYPFQ